MKNSTAISCGRNFICKKLSGEIKEGSESDFSEFEFKNLIWGDNLTMLNGLFVIKSGK